MKKILFLTAIFCLAAVSILAQNKPDFSGRWELDTINSKMDERMRVESMSMKVDQTENSITIGTFTKRAVRTDGSGGMNRGDGVVPQALTYSLVEGTASKGDSVSANGSEKSSEAITLKASIGADGKLNLSSVRKLNTNMGEMTITVKETWELADEGKTLKVARTMETPRGTQNSELVFTKKDETSDAAMPTDAPVSTSKILPKVISGGVLNGKATSLVKPVYPEAAKAVKASGTVNVQITIGEDGNVVSASAVSGHPLLRAAAEDAARSSKFTPTLLEGAPVKVNGVIIYNFAP